MTAWLTNRWIRRAPNHVSATGLFLAAVLGRSALPPTGTVVPIGSMPGDPGEHGFTYHVGMLRGRNAVESV